LKKRRHQVRHHHYASKCPNQLRLHQEDHRRKEENDQDHQFLDQIYKPEDTISSEDNHQERKCKISWEIEEADHHLGHLQDFNNTKILNYNWFNHNGETDPHHHLSQNLTLHHLREEFMAQDLLRHHNL
jgi:hypothetical protein